MARNDESWPVPAMAGLTLAASWLSLAVAGMAGHFLTLEEFALMATALAIVATLAALASGSGLLPPLLQTLHPPAAAQAGWRRTATPGRAALVLALALGLAVATACGPGAGLFARLVPVSDFGAIAPVAGALVALLALSAVLAGAYAALGRLGLETAFAPSAPFGGAVTAGLTAILLGAVLWSGGPLDIMVVLGLVLLARALAAAVGAVLLGGEIGCPGGAQPRPTGADPPMVALAFLATLLAGTETWILLARADLVALAQLTAALLLVGACLAPLGAAHAAIGPFLGALHALGEQASLERLARAATTIGAVPALLFLAAAFLWPERLLSLVFGTSFTPAAAAVRALVPGAAIAALAGPGLAVIAATGHARTALLFAILGALATLGLGLLLVGPFGATGLAGATSAGLALVPLLANLHLAARRGLTPAAYRHPDMVLMSLIAFFEEVGRLFPVRRRPDAYGSYQG